jgi:hypothetical protein
MEIPEGKFNRHGVAENSIVLKEWGDHKSLYFITAVRVGERIYTGYEHGYRRNNVGGGGHLPLSHGKEIFRSEVEAVAWHKEHVKEIFRGMPDDLAVILKSIAAGEQLLLFG